MLRGRGPHTPDRAAHQRSVKGEQQRNTRNRLEVVGDKIGHSRTLEVADKAGQHQGKDGGQSKVLGKTD